MVARQIGGDLLDEKGPERHAFQTVLAVRDRIEDRRVRLIGGEDFAVFAQHLLDGFRNPAGQRDFDEDQRLVRQGGMEEAEAAPVLRLQAAAQILPAVDLMHRLIGDDLLQ